MKGMPLVGKKLKGYQNKSVMLLKWHDGKCAHSSAYAYTSEHRKAKPKYTPINC
jgi:hypothetical protein